MPGLVIAAATAFHVFLKYAKLWELQRIQPGRKGSDETRDDTRADVRDEARDEGRGGTRDGTRDGTR